uniref:Deoxyuridine 5'-triphosphate nucleotidohydrolase n=1 Tax=Chelydra serpentina TaxID=8475 RepID=A0A8C3SWM1_CHESE
MHLGHLGTEGAYCWAQAQGIPTSHVALKQLKPFVRFGSGQSDPDALGVLMIHPVAHLLTRGTPESAGMDLYTVTPNTIDPGTQKLIPIGIQVQLHRGCYGRVAPHSGLALHHDYRGEVRVLLFNLRKAPVNIQPGDRVAQLICEQIALPKVRHPQETEVPGEEGGRVWAWYHGQRLQSGKIIARGPGDTYWGSINKDNDIVCLDRGKLL